MTLDDIFDLYAEIRLAAKLADAELSQVGDGAIIEIPDAKKVNALLLKGKGGARYRIDALHLTKEK